jgi:2-hydroxymuconate-semialdehyde hydrolase
MFDTGLYGDRIRQIAEDRAALAAREDVRRSHLRTFSMDGPPLVFTEEVLAGIRHEVLLVHGREDRIIPKESSYYLADLLPNAQLHVLPHAGHWVQIEQVDRFRALATMFLGEPSSASSSPAGTHDGGAA